MRFRTLREWYNLKFRRQKFEGIIKSLCVTEDYVEARFKPPPEFVAFIKILVQTFQDAGAVNFLTFTATDPANFETYTITVKRHTGREPEELAGILRQSLERIEAGTVDARSEAGRVLELCGYKQAP